MKTLKFVFPLLFISAIVLFLLPSAARYANDNSTLAGEEPYYHARIVSQILSHGIFLQDSLVEGRPYHFNPYHFVLAAPAYLLGVFNASILVPLFSGLLSLCLLYLLLKKLKLNHFAIFSILGVFILSPVSSYAFALSTPACLIILLNLLGVYFFIKGKPFFFVFSALFFSITAFFGIIHAAVSAAIVFFYTYYAQKGRKQSYLILALLCIIIFAYCIPVYLQQESTSFVQKSLAADFISDLGGLNGFSVFMILLAVIGLIGLWKHKKEHYLLYAASILIVICSFFNNVLIVYSNFVLVFFAGIAFSGLARMKWRLVQVRNFSLLVLFCGLLFSAVSHAVLLSALPPDEDTKDALLWLANRSEPADKIFSHYSKGFWIEFWADRPVVIDGLLSSTPRVASLYVNSNAVFQSDDLAVTRALLSRHNVKYIFMTKDMMQGLVWDKSEEGLSFLLSNSETFKKRYANPSCEIYEYIYTEK